MKLIYKITIRVSIAITLVLILWAVLFYYAMIDEINDEVVDSLKNYSKRIIKMSSQGEILPTSNNEVNNYTIKKVSADYAAKHKHTRYIDSVVYINSKGETEPVRIYTKTFIGKDNQYYELIVSMPSFEKDDIIEAILYWIIILYATLTLTLITLNVWLVYRTMRPMYIILKWLDNYKLGTPHVSLNNNTEITEFWKLNNAIIRFVERANEMFEQQKQFTENASHEMQTPIAMYQPRHSQISFPHLTLRSLVSLLSASRFT